ncbi:MAG: ribonuclease III [Pseudomonadales bacterium]|nr:ribonuclease III [Pseudomonadales bacterium]
MSSSSSRNSTSTSDRLVPLARLESALGYRFADPALLEQALTHKSHGRPHNERLEFLGDAVLGYVVADRLYHLRPDEHEDVLSLIRSSLVRRETLAAVARELDLGRFLRLGIGERRSGGHRRPSILADALEAVIGAVHIDGGIDAARQLVDRVLETRMADASTLTTRDAKDAKTRLQEHLQAANLALPEYRIEETSGSAHARIFTVRCRVAALDLAVVAQGPSRRAAETEAAARMLEQVAAIV